MVAFADRDSTITPALLSPEILASRRTIAASPDEPEVRVRLDQPMPDAVGLKLGWIIAFYALAKLFELADFAIYEATRHLVSGHTLKHLAASLAGLPVLVALQAVGKDTLRHNPGAAALTA